MKTIKKFWGVVFILALLSTLFIGAVPQASANPYAFADSLWTPNSVAGDVTLAPSVGGAAPDGFSVLDVAQSGTTIIATATDNTAVDWIYRSTNGGASWARVIPAVGPVAGIWSLVAIAPDNPSIIAIVDTAPASDIVYLSNNGGITFSALTAFASGTAWVNDIAISPLLGGSYFLVAIGNNENLAAPVGDINGFILQWTIGAVAPTWVGLGAVGPPAVPPAFNNGNALAFSPNFLADNALLFVTSNVTSLIAGFYSNTMLHVFSYNTKTWDNVVNTTFPRNLERNVQTYLPASPTANGTQTAVRVEITLDSNFYLDDAASQTGFIGASITDNVAAEIGGVYSVGSFSSAAGIFTSTQILTGTAINSVAYDGTNLMAAQYDNVAFPSAALTVWRCANPLATTGWSFLPNSTFKTPGTGSFPRVLFNSGVGYAFSRGSSSAVAKTTDYGKSFNGIALVNSHFCNMLDFWVSPDGSRMYAVTSDNTDLNLWRRDGSTWQRVFILANVAAATVAGDPAWLVRASASDPNTVYLGLKATNSMYKATDAGDFTWTVRSSPVLLADFAVQDATTLYVVSNAAATVTKSTNGGFIWGSAVTTSGTGGAGGVGYSINLIAADQIVVGNAAGGVAYSANGGTSFTYLGAQAGVGNTLVEASGLAAGNTVWALDCAGAGAVYYWTIGTSVRFIASATATVGATGMVYSDGVLYVQDSGTPALNRYLYPAVPARFAAATDALPGTNANYTQQNMVNSLQAVQGASNTLYARNADLSKLIIDTIDTLSDYVTGADDAPVPTYPTNNAIISINSISGAVAAFVFQWQASPTISSTGAFNTVYNYNVEVYLDAAGTIPVAGSPIAPQIVASPAPSAAVASNLLAAAFAGVPGTTYYWRVRVDSLAPAESYWSSMQTFVVQQLTAIVPVISSPANGGEVTTVNPAFSWSPIANATSYRFELSMTANFSNIVYTVDPVTAGAAVPSTIMLTRGMQYFWHVKALAPTEGAWSTTANFIVAQLPPTTAPPVTITTAPQPTIIVNQPTVTITPTQIVIPPTETKEVNPSYIWAIIIVGAVLVIAVIILIVRTRRTV